MRPESSGSARSLGLWQLPCTIVNILKSAYPEPRKILSNPVSPSPSQQSQAKLALKTDTLWNQKPKVVLKPVETILSIWNPTTEPSIKVVRAPPHPLLRTSSNPNGTHDLLCKSLPESNAIDTKNGITCQSEKRCFTFGRLPKGACAVTLVGCSLGSLGL